jgi:hypothetical protein
MKQKKSNLFFINYENYFIENFLNLKNKNLDFYGNQ